MAAAGAKLAVLQQAAKKGFNAAQARDANGQWVRVGGQQATAQARRELIKTGLDFAATAATGGLPLQSMAAGAVATGIDMGAGKLAQKVVSSKAADKILEKAGKTIAEKEHSPEESKIAKAINAAIENLPELAAKVGTTQLLAHGINAALTGLHVDPMAGAAISHIAAAGLEPGVRQGANYLVQRFKQKRMRHATA